MTKERDALMDHAIDCGVPSHLIDGLMRYITVGCPLGDFLTAVMENNLMEAFGRADTLSELGMKGLCTFLYNYAPAQCHGSPGKVKAWYEMRLKAREVDIRA